MDATTSTKTTGSLILLILALVLTGCGQGGDGGEPKNDGKGDGGKSGGGPEKLELIEPKADEPAMMNPNLAKEKAPETYEALIETNEGTFRLKLTRAWSPQAADRFYNMVKIGYLDGCRFFRVVQGFVAQFGMHGDPKIYGAWKNFRILDDQPEDRRRNDRGTIVFAKTNAANSRTVQLFINLVSNADAPVGLDRMGFTPFGYVTDGMSVVDKLYAGYGEGAPRGSGPNQALIETRGNAYLAEQFPELDYIIKARLIKQ